MRPGTEAAVVKTPEVFVEVVTILDEDASDVRGIAPPVAIRKSYFRLYIIIAIVFWGFGDCGCYNIIFISQKTERD